MVGGPSPSGDLENLVPSTSRFCHVQYVISKVPRSSASNWKRERRFERGRLCARPGNGRLLCHSCSTGWSSVTWLSNCERPREGVSRRIKERVWDRPSQCLPQELNVKVLRLKSRVFPFKTQGPSFMVYTVYLMGASDNKIQLCELRGQKR